MGVGVAPGNAHLVVTWTAVDTATGYTVQWTSGSEDYNTGDRQAPVTTGSTTRYTIPSLINGTAYTVRVIATRTGVTDGPPSAEVTATPVTTHGQQLLLDRPRLRFEGESRARVCGRGWLRRSATAQRCGAARVVGASASRLEPADTRAPRRTPASATPTVTMAMIGVGGRR